MIIPDFDDVRGELGVDSTADKRQQVAPKEHLDDPDAALEISCVLTRRQPPRRREV